MKKLVLLDGNAILHRAYHALPPLTSRLGQPVNAVYGFLTMLFRAIADLKPTHLAATFDTEKPTFRHVEYVGYQAQRPRMESDLADQIDLVQEILTAAGIPIYVAPGFEADDVIGTLAFQSQSLKTQKPEVIIVTGDRDLLQLIGKRVRVYAPIRGLTETQMFDIAAVGEKMGITPSQIVDYKALVGDASDNYPGVAGIGPKTAVTLLEKFRTLDRIYKNLNKLEPTLVSKLTEGYDSAMLSKKLAKIVTDAPVEFNLAKMKLRALSGNEKFIKKLSELGFKSLVARLEDGPSNGATKKPRNRKAEQQLKLV